MLRSFLKKGYEETYKEQIAQLSKSFVPLTHILDEKDVYHRVMRCIDEVEFTVGDLVKYSNHGSSPDEYNKKPLRIGRLYSDDRGLNVQLIVSEEEGITWRDLSQVQHV